VQCAILVASNGVSAENGGWGYKCPQCGSLLVAIGPARRHPFRARAIRAPGSAGSPDVVGPARARHAGKMRIHALRGELLWLGISKATVAPREREVWSAWPDEVPAVLLPPPGRQLPRQNPSDGSSAEPTATIRRSQAFSTHLGCGPLKWETAAHLLTIS
jgi:hypothetical protein